MVQSRQSFAAVIVASAFGTAVSRAAFLGQFSDFESNTGERSESHNSQVAETGAPRPHILRKSWRSIVSVLSSRSSTYSQSSAPNNHSTETSVPNERSTLYV
ncbi:hypothetical protein SeMB42_g00963 [Synchytrium endobioticum]|uniref:Uncharacterized protein n=1 Tax=Synchytrium endobioticum TaxID=286115 RepID=A0A507DC68_9FUNG|nr:hypothetical protein SeLEV6574_g01739 [Synchytrium endobioticum]TPX53158.1 hypothetical protein SeMB42_g00963 [Synchytrium endobioticum]